MNGAWALRAAIYAALTGDGGLQVLIGNPARVYDDVPAAAIFPFVTLGEGSASDWSTMTERGAEHLITLHVWSHYEGHKEAADILGLMEALLHDAGLSLSGHALVDLSAQGSEILRDPAAAITHGVIRFRAVTEPTS